MRYFIITFCLGVLSICASAQSQFKTLDSVLIQLSKDQLFHGQVLIAEQGKVKFSKAYGLSTEGKAINSETPIDIQSVAKGITALSVLQLHEKGKLSIEDPLSKYFPSLNYPGVQLKYMLNHTSGLPMFFELVFDKWPHDQFLTIAAMVDLAAQHKPQMQSEPREFEQYNQTAYMLLASVVEKASGQSFTQYVRENIFEPAGMTHTYFNIERPDFREELGAANIDNQFALMLGDGNIQSTAEDLFRLNQAIYSGKLISERVMEQSYVPAVLGNGKMGRYGYGGSMIEMEEGKRQFQHIGQGTTSNAVFSKFIDTNDVLIVLHDQSVQYAQPVYMAVLNIWKDQPYELPKKRVVHQLSAELIQKYVGDYGDNGFMHITTENGKVFIQPDGNPSRVEIIPSSDTTFYFEDQDMNWEIYLDEQGNVIGFGPMGEPNFMMKRWKK